MRACALLIVVVATAAGAQPGGETSAGPMRASAGSAKFSSVPIWFSGWFWADTGYMARSNAEPGQYDQDAAYLQGRFALGATYLGKWDDWLAVARVQLLGLVNEFAKSQYEPHTLDAYVLVGHSKWFNLQVGRFLAWEVYHRGQGIELWTAEEAGAFGGPAMTWLEQTRGYQNEAGQLALHVFPFDALSIEVAGVYGQDNNQNSFGVRPVLDLRIHDFALVAGYEYLRRVPQTEADKVELTLHGAAGRVEYQFPHVRAGAEYAWSHVDRIDIQGLLDSDKSLVKMTFGGFADVDFWRLSLGLGYHHTQQLNRQGEHNTQEQTFASLRFDFPIPGFSAKAVYGFALAHVEDADSHSAFQNTMHSFRVRLAYEFE